MRRILSWASWLIMVPLLAVAVVFALNNKSLVALDLWPFGLVVELPIYLALFAVLGLGVLVGGCVAWLGQGRVRSDLRGQAYAAEVARRELQAARAKAAVLEKTMTSPLGADESSCASDSENVLVVSKTHASPPAQVKKVHD